MFRKTISLTSLLSFLITLFTSVVLYITPHGRVAYWSDWTFLGLSKTQWGDIHITVGLLFCIVSLLHIFLNWKPITAYLKNRAREMVVLTTPMVFSMILVIAVTAGTLLHIQPMQAVLDFGESIKEKQTATLGNPPYGHAELSPLRVFCAHMGFDLAESLDTLKKAGYTKKLNASAKLVDIAHANGVTPQHVYLALRNAFSGDDIFRALPPKAPEGTGKLTLQTLGSAYSLPMEEMIGRLSKAGLEATPEMTLKQIAQKHNTSPKKVYEILRGNNQ